MSSRSAAKPKSAIEPITASAMCNSTCHSLAACDSLPHYVASSQCDSLVEAEPLNRRQLLCSAVRAALAGTLVSSGLSSGCVSSVRGNLKTPDLIWGRKGLSDGRLMKPRAMAIDRQDRVFLVDMTGRIQVFDRDGKFIRMWRTPETAQGRPTGLGIALDGSLMVADTHYFRVLFYTPEGELQTERTIGGEFGDKSAQFHFVTDVAQNSRGHVFAGQYGLIDQIQEFSPSGDFLKRWGKQGSDLDSFARPQGLLFDRDDRLWIADACNHRVLVFKVDTTEPQLIQSFGSLGSLPGELRYPYGVAFGADNSLLVAEYGNHRVQRFSTSGESLETWGEPGNAPGQFSSPWALAVDSRGATHVLDTLNHRVQRFRG